MLTNKDEFGLIAHNVWGKTGERSRDTNISANDWHPLLAHLTDSLHVADRLWDTYLSPAFHELLSQDMPGKETEKQETARTVFRWLASLHDLGKCTPGFQGSSCVHSERVRRVLPMSYDPPYRSHRSHQMLSAHLLYGFLIEEGWDSESAVWAANVVGGHHGVFPEPGAVEAYRLPETIGGSAWRKVQREIFRRMTEAAEVPLTALSHHVPPIGAQMACAGGVILADWLASNEQLFPYANGLPPEYATASAGIAADYAKTMQLGEVWRPRAAPDAETYFAERLDISTPRGTQLVAYDVALTMDGPGLMVVEAPTGEGKTEAALAAAEVMADRFGFNGLYFGLPTQATTNALFDRVLEKWVDRMPQRPRPTVGLAHGKAVQHDRFADLPLAGVGEDEAEGATASQWMRGSKKALLCPIAVGTVDQLLFAGVSAPHVMLRHVALVNKVVVVDEVHAYDAHMSAILHRALAWLGAHRVPVVLLSATLPPAQRDALLAAYAPGAEAGSAAAAGYPVVSWVTAPVPEIGEPTPIRRRAAEADPDRAVSLRVTCRDEPDDGAVGVAADIAARTADGGCVLVVRNTVPRAQQTYDALRAHFDADELTLAHARFTADDRRRLDQSLVERFGPPLTPEEGEAVERPQRPRRHIVVATQVAEASLDVDFDLVVSDLAPIDYLLQRAGRLHRHHRPGPRPAGLAAPELVVVGHIGGGGDTPPVFPTFDDRPYLHHFLLRTRAELRKRSGVLSIPAAVPGLISSVYGDDDGLIPQGWKAVADTAALTMREAMENLRKTAVGKLLAAPGGPDDEIDLGDVMPVKSHQVEEEAAGNALRVRVGPPSVEVVLLRRLDDTTAETVSHGDPVPIPLDRTPPTPKQRQAALGQVIRIPQKWVASDRLLRPRGWRHAPWSRGLDVFLLDHRTGQSSPNGAIDYDVVRGVITGEKQLAPKAARPSFDLARRPWLPCVAADGAVKELSLRDALVRAHELRDLTVDAPNQYPALIRFLITVLHRALGATHGKGDVSWPRRKAQWRRLYAEGAFPPEAIDTYLDTWHDRFDLFHPERPFFQAADARPPHTEKPQKGKKTSKVEEDAGKPSSLLVPHAASGNNAPIFSAARDAAPAALTPAEAARWLVHVHAWDTAGIKTGAHNDPQAARGKTTGNRVGLLGQQGVLIPTGRTLWQTLMFNLTVLSDDISPATDIPFWERRAPLDSRWRSRLPDGVLDLYCWPSRRVLLLADPAPDTGDGWNPTVRRVLVCAGDRLLDESTLRGLEPHTAWYAVRPNGRQAAKDTEPQRFRPMRHQPGRALWRGLGAILGRRGESGDGGPRFERPRVIGHLQTMGRFIQADVVQIRAFGTTYGIQNAVVEETYTDTLPLPVAVLAPRGNFGLDRVAVSSVEDSEGVARALSRYASDVAFCSGADEDAQKQQADDARRRFYALLDQPFRTWVAELTEEELLGDYRADWQRCVRTAAWRIARAIRGKAPPTTLRTRIRTPQREFEDSKARPMNLTIAGLDFERALRRELSQSGWSAPEDISASSDNVREERAS